MDLRTQRTYDALIGAFAQLLEEKPVDDIAVNELCERAQVRRATFYNHFRDKYAFLDYVILQARAKQTSLVEKQTDGADPVAFFTSLLRSTLHFLAENEQKVRNLRTSNAVFFLMNIGPEQLARQLREVLEGYQDAGFEMVSDPEVMAQSLMGAMGQLGHWWLSSEGASSVDDAVDRFVPILAALFPTR